jgi:YVTN family beta-propeller protein
MGRRDAHDLAVELVASYEGSAVLTSALGQPELMAAKPGASNDGPRRSTPDSARAGQPPISTSSNTVTVINTVTKTIEKTIKVGKGPLAIRLTP